MPQIIAKQIHLESNWFSAERDIVRSKGLHLSQVIDYIEYLEGKRATAQQGPINNIGNAYAAAGFSWERVVSNLIEHKPTDLWDWMFGRALSEPTNPLVVRPGEQSMDAGVCPVCKGKGSTYDKLTDPVKICQSCHGLGRIIVYMTPDGLNIEESDQYGKSLLEEWKATSKSCRDVDILGPKFKRWTLFQIPCYLKVLNLRTCKLQVFFWRGNYTDGVPQWWQFLLSFSQQELDETWDMIAQHALIMVREGVI